MLQTRCGRFIYNITIYRLERNTICMISLYIGFVLLLPPILREFVELFYQHSHHRGDRQI